MENNIEIQKNTARRVDNGCRNDIKTIFETLLLQKKCKQQDLADYLNVDKAYVSRMVHGLQFPPLRIRLKVAEFFSVDSCLIWRNAEVKDVEQEVNEYFESIGIKVGGIENGH